MARRRKSKKKKVRKTLAKIGKGIQKTQKFARERAERLEPDWGHGSRYKKREKVDITSKSKKKKDVDVATKGYKLRTKRQKVKEEIILLGRGFRDVGEEGQRLARKQAKRMEE